MNRSAAAGLASESHSPFMRLDPMALPARFKAAVNGATAEAPASVLLDGDSVTLTGSADGASFHRMVPLSDYRGVAVRIVPAEGGDLSITVELLHADPALTIPLIVAATPGEIVADWQCWAKVLRRPLLLVGEDGSIVEPTPRMGGVGIRALKPRRLHSFFAARRPRFLTRRKTGRAHLTTDTVLGREIIARGDR